MIKWTEIARNFLFLRTTYLLQGCVRVSLYSILSLFYVCYTLMGDILQKNKGNVYIFSIYVSFFTLSKPLMFLGKRVVLGRPERLALLTTSICTDEVSRLVTEYYIAPLSKVSTLWCKNSCNSDSDSPYDSH